MSELLQHFCALPARNQRQEMPEDGILDTESVTNYL